MEYGQPRRFNNPEEEISYLREEIAKRERELLERHPNTDQSTLETVSKDALKEYGTFTPEKVLQQDYQLSEADKVGAKEKLQTTTDQVSEIVLLAKERGIHNALSVMEKVVSDAYTIDEIHRALIEEVKNGVQVQGLKEGVPPWQLLHMILYEVSLPEVSEQQAGKRLSEVISMMEQFYAGMQAVGQGSGTEHYVIEIAVADNSDDIAFYVSVPNAYNDLFQKQLLSLYPHALLTEMTHDYNIFVDGGVSRASLCSLVKHHIYPIATKDSFESDPISIILNAFSKIERNGGGAALQIVIKSEPNKYQADYEGIIKRVREGMKPAEAIKRSSFSGDMFASFKELIFSQVKNDEQSPPTVPTVDNEALEFFAEKMRSPNLSANIRIASSSQTTARSEQILSDIEATFHQFERSQSNHFVFKRLYGNQLKRSLKAFSFREFHKSAIIPLSIRELATVMHFPAHGLDSSPQFKQSRAKTAAAPTNMPGEGTLLGINDHRGTQTKIYITPEDRMRHFYIIGQTGTGKTTLMKNMIVQDIEDGAGVCMIDPHGTDIEDVLGAVPPEREKDIIYFDPSSTNRVLGLNMLEYDPNKPEQKTFVVNELFSIFQKLYSANPEAVGPMFEQYFRNSTQLVMEDPATGNTLLDISRVMSDSKYRAIKLARAKNPVVIQFWKKIATKAGGEASLENIVPYIVSKIDTFTANDYLRPIIGQQKSSFNFRSIMDEKKILLVNLSKGRLGDINAHLIGMIIVGKLLMAALSRVDDPTKSFPPFYLHMDEFQNVSTNSISAILSEARKYKLGLTIAHQFIAQLSPEIKDAVFGNVGSIATFRVGPEDAQFLEQQFKPTFNEADLMNVPNRTAYLRVLANGTPTKPFSIKTLPPKPVDHERVAMLIEQSGLRYGVSRQELEDELMSRYQQD